MENQDILRNAAGENWDFGDLRLMSGQPMNLSNAQSKQQYKVQFIGALHGHSLITTLPKELADLWLKPSDLFVLRGLANTHAFAISCHPISVSDKPYPHIHFAYPEMALVRKARNASRVALKLPLELMRGEATNATNATTELGMLVDISTTGAGITSAASLGNPGDVVQAGIPIILEPHTQRIVIPASIAWSVPDAKFGYRHGLSFSTLPPGEDLLLRAIIGHHLSLHGGSS